MQRATACWSPDGSVLRCTCSLLCVDVRLCCGGRRWWRHGRRRRQVRLHVCCVLCVPTPRLSPASTCSIPATILSPLGKSLLGNSLLVTDVFMLCSSGLTLAAAAVAAVAMAKVASRLTGCASSEFTAAALLLHHVHAACQQFDRSASQEYSSTSAAAGHSCCQKLSGLCVAFPVLLPSPSPYSCAATALP